MAGTYYLQLDTGAGWPRWYEVPLRQVLPRIFGSRRDTAPEVIIRGRVGTTSFARDPFLIEKGFGDSLPASSSPNDLRVIGTLGLRFFRDRVLVLDFPHQRFAIVGREDAMPLGMPSAITYVPPPTAPRFRLRTFGTLQIAGSADFAKAIELGDTESAVGHYGGSFLKGFYLSDAPEFE